MTDEADVLEDELCGLKQQLAQLRASSRDKTIVDLIAETQSNVFANAPKIKLRTRSKLRGHAAKVYSDDANCQSSLLSTSQDSTLILWDTIRRFKLKAIDLECAWTMTCALGSAQQSNDICASAGMDGVVTIHSLLNHQYVDSGRLLRCLYGHDGFISAVDFWDNSKKVLSASADRTCKLWDLATGQEIGNFRGHSSEIYCMASEKARTKESGHSFATGSADRSLKLWDDRMCGQRKSSLTVPDLHDADINAVAFFPSDQAVATASDDCSIKLVDLRASQCIQTFTVPMVGMSVIAEAITIPQRCMPERQIPEYDQIAKPVYLDRIQSKSMSQIPNTIFDANFDKASVRSNNNTRQNSSVFSSNIPITGVDFSSSGRLLFCGCDNFDCVIFDSLTGELLKWLHGHENRIQAVSVNRTGTALATASWDSTIRIWN